MRDWQWRTEGWAGLVRRAGARRGPRNFTIFISFYILEMI